MIWAWIWLHVLYEKNGKTRQCLWLQKFTQQKSIFVEGLNFYLEHNTVRAVWSHSTVYLIYWASFVTWLLFGGKRRQQSPSAGRPSWEFVWLMLLRRLCQCACIQWIAVYRWTRRITVWFVPYMMSWTLFCKSLRCSHYWLSVVSLPFGSFV